MLELLEILFSKPHFEVKLSLQSQRQHQVKFKTSCHQNLAIPARTSMINPLANSIKSNAKSDVISPKTVLESLEILFSNPHFEVKLLLKIQINIRLNSKLCSIKTWFFYLLKPLASSGPYGPLLARSGYRTTCILFK